MITDWAGNEIKPGIQVAFLQTVIHHWAGGIMWPAGSQKDSISKYEETQVAHDEPCWILGYFKIVQADHKGNLYVDVVEKGAGELEGFTFHSKVYLNGDFWLWDKPPVLAIKLISDTKPDKI